MRDYRIVDLSLPIINDGGFRKPAQITYLDHRIRANMLCEQLGISPDAIGGMANAVEEFSYLNTHNGTHIDAPWHYGAIAEGKPAMTIDEIPLEWCYGDGVWLDMSQKQPGDDITAEDVQQALEDIQYTLKPMDIVLIRTGAAASYGQPGCQRMNAGMTREATLWLGDHGIRMVGIDATCWDSPPEMQMAELQKGVSPSRYMEAHRAAGEKGMCIIEWLTNLDLLPHFGFTVYAFPVKVERAGAGWARVVAFVRE